MQQDMEEARAYCQDIKARAVKCGRNPDAVKVMPGLMPGLMLLLMLMPPQDAFLNY